MFGKEEVKGQETAKKVNPKRVAKNEALKVLKTFADASKDQKIIDALKIIKPSLYGISGGGGVSGVVQKFIKTLVERKQVSEEDIFKEFKIGRKEAGQMIRKGLKRAEPANRQWIKFDAARGLYIHVGSGKDAPSGWEGYIPVEEATIIQK